MSDDSGFIVVPPGLTPRTATKASSAREQPTSEGQAHADNRIEPPVTPTARSPISLDPARQPTTAASAPRGNAETSALSVTGILHIGADPEMGVVHLTSGLISLHHPGEQFMILTMADHLGESGMMLEVNVQGGATIVTSGTEPVRIHAGVTTPVPAGTTIEFGSCRITIERA